MVHTFPLRISFSLLLCGKKTITQLLVFGFRGLLQMGEKKLRQAYNDHIHVAIAAATFSPSIQALIIPPAYPAPSPAGYSL